MNNLLEAQKYSLTLFSRLEMLLEIVQENSTFFFFSAIVLARFSSPRNTFVLEFYFRSSGGWEVAVISNLESLKVSFNFIYLPGNIVGRNHEGKKKQKQVNPVDTEQPVDKFRMQ